MQVFVPAEQLPNRKSLKIKRAQSLLERNALYRVGVNHGGSHIAVPQQLLNGAYVIITLQQVAGEAVAKGMGTCAFANLSVIDRLPDRLLDVGFMQMVAPIFPGLVLMGQ